MVKFVERISSKKIRIWVDGLEVEIFEMTAPEEILQAVGKDPICHDLVQKTSSEGYLLLPKKTEIVFKEGDSFSIDPYNAVN